MNEALKPHRASFSGVFLNSSQHQNGTLKYGIIINSKIAIYLRYLNNFYIFFAIYEYFVFILFWSLSAFFNLLLRREARVLYTESFV